MNKSRILIKKKYIRQITFANYQKCLYCLSR